MQASIRSGKSITPYLCTAPATPLKYGAWTPSQERLLEEQFDDASLSSEEQQLIKKLMESVGSNPESQVTVVSVSGNIAHLRYNVSPRAVSQEVDSTIMSMSGLSEEEVEELLSRRGEDAFSFPYTAEKRDGTWCVFDE